MFGQGLSDFYDIHNAQPDSNGLIEAALIPLGDLVLYPNMVTPLFVSRERSLEAVTAAPGKQQTVSGIAQINARLPDPHPHDIDVFRPDMALGLVVLIPHATSSARPPRRP